MSEWQTQLKTAPFDEPVLVVFETIPFKGNPAPTAYVWAARKIHIRGKAVWVGLDDDSNHIGDPLAWREWPQAPEIRIASRA